MRKLVLAVIVVGCGARSDLSGVPVIDAGATQPADSFVFSISPTSFTITQGGDPIALAVHVDRQAPFNGKVDVSIPALPTGLSATSSALGPGVSEATLMLTASLQSQQGTAQPIVVHATTASAGQKTASLNVFVRGCPGCLDTTFGTNGRTTVANFPAYLAIDSSDRIILGTIPPSVDTPTHGIVVRFDEDGNADSSFGVNGEADTPFVLAWSALSLDVNDRVLVAGATLDTFNFNAPEYGVAIRFSANGLLDSTFGNSGSVGVSTTPTTFGALAPLPDGSFISAGQTWSDSEKQNGVMWLPKVLSSGAFDATFGNGGISVDAWQSESSVLSGIVRVADDQFVVGGSSFASINDPHFALARFNGDGSPDTTFGTNGQLVSDVPGTALSLILTPANHYFICGSVWQGGANDFAQYAMFMPDGTPDKSFGLSGVITSSLMDYGYEGRCLAQSDGKLIALGSAGTSSYMLRMNADGTFDNAFATKGVVTLDFDVNTFVDVGPVLQSDGRIVVAGDSGSMNNPPQSFLLRYWN